MSIECSGIQNGSLVVGWMKSIACIKSTFELRLPHILCIFKVLNRLPSSKVDENSVLGSLSANPSFKKIPVLNDDAWAQKQHQQKWQHTNASYTHIFKYYIDSVNRISVYADVFVVTCLYVCLCCCRCLRRHRIEYTPSLHLDRVFYTLETWNRPGQTQNFIC